MNGHPGGRDHTLELIRLAGLRPPADILDMGAGDGTALRLLQQLGFHAVGIDLQGGDGVSPGDFFHAPYGPASFDALLAQCSFFVSGDVPRAFAAAYALLKPGGVLLYSDVAPRSTVGPQEIAEQAGFRVSYRRDMTDLWKEYYIDCLWRGETVPCRFRGRTYNYYLLICRKGE
jgi:SAM-dependent methyltransferase